MIDIKNNLQIKSAFTFQHKKTEKNISNNNSFDEVLEKSCKTNGFMKEISNKMEWGEWTKIDDKFYRQITPPGPATRGVTWFSDTDGNCYIRPVLPDAKMEKVETPEWFSSEGIGTAPETVDEQQIRIQKLSGINSENIPAETELGEWTKIDDKFYRQITPPGPALDGISWFADEDGNCYVKPIVPNAQLEKVQTPGWFSLGEIGVPPENYQENIILQKPLVNEPEGLNNEMEWGEWTKIDDKSYRQITPPGPALDGVSWFADMDGNCYVKPIVPSAQLEKVIPPVWFNFEGIGIPDFLGYEQK